MRDKERFVQLINQQLVQEERSQAWLARKLETSEANVSRWLDPLLPTLPSNPDVIHGMVKCLSMDEDQTMQLFAAAGLVYQPASDQDASQTPTASDGIAIGTLHADGAKIIVGDDATMIVNTPSDSLPQLVERPSPEPPLSVRPYREGLSAIIVNEAERTFRVQLNYTIQVHRSCTLLNMDYDFPLPGAVELPDRRQFKVNGQDQAFGANLRLRATPSLRPGSYAIFHAKTWRVGSSASLPADESEIALQVEVAEAGKVGSNIIDVHLQVNANGGLHVSGETISSAPTLVANTPKRDSLLRQLADHRALLLKLEEQAILATGREQAALAVLIDKEKESILAIERCLDELEANDNRL